MAQPFRISQNSENAKKTLEIRCNKNSTLFVAEFWSQKRQEIFELGQQKWLQN